MKIDDSLLATSLVNFGWSHTQDGQVLLVHGRLSYIRTSRLVLYSFYKNAVLSVCLLLFVCNSLFSAQNMFDSISLAGFNVVFAAIPIVFFAILDQDVKAEQVFAHPKLYEIGQRGEQFGLGLLWAWFGYGIFHAFIIYFGMLMFFEWGVINQDGTTYDLWSIAIIGFSAVVLVVNLKVAVETYYWTWLNYLGIAVTLGFWFLYSIIYTSFPEIAGQEYYVTQHVWASPSFWFFLVIITCVCLLPDMSFRYIYRNYFPETRHVVQEIQMEGRLERKKLRQKGFVVKKPTIMMLPLDSSVKNSGDHTQKPHLGYAFAQDDHAASQFSLSLGSLLKKQINKRKAKRAARKKKVKIDMPL